MSTNEPAHPNSSRRLFLSVGSAALAAPVAIGAVVAPTTGADPVLALIAAERAAHAESTVVMEAEEPDEVTTAAMYASGDA